MVTAFPLHFARNAEVHHNLKVSNLVPKVYSYSSTNPTDHDSAKILPREKKPLYGIYHTILASYTPGVTYWHLTSKQEEQFVGHI